MMKSNPEPTIVTTSDIILCIEEIARDSEGAMRHALNAQMEVLKVLEDPSLLVPTVDTVLQYLHDGIEAAGTEEESRLLKKDSSLLIQSLLFVGQSQLLSSNKNNRDLLMKMCVQATECAVNFAVVAAPIMTLRISAKARINKLVNKIQSLKKQNTSSSPSIIENLGLLIRNLFQAKKNKEKYYIALDHIFDKLMRHKELLGTSILLSESVRNNADQLIEFQIRNDLKKYYDLRDDYEDIVVAEPVLNFSTVALGIAVFIHLILEFVDLFREDNHSYWYVYLIPMLTGLATYFYYFNIKKKAYNKLSSAEMLISEKENTLREKYNVIAEVLTPKLA